MITRTNCPNCGAPVQLGSPKCPYCDTPYIWTLPPVPGAYENGMDPARLHMLLDMGAITPNEARRRLGLPPIEEN